LFAIKSFRNKSERYNKLIKSKEAENMNWIQIKNPGDEKIFWSALASDSKKVND